MNNRKSENNNIQRRQFVKSFISALGVMMIPGILSAGEQQRRIAEWIVGDSDYKPAEHYWGMGIDINKCIGCGRCAASCKIENDVPQEPFFFRTWVERYQINADGSTTVDSPNGAVKGFKSNDNGNSEAVRTFFVPKICNHCDHPPCVQVCPVGATFITPDGVILVDAEHCIGCRYCIQSCPYGARFLDPRTKVAEKCTFCYHRIVDDKIPVCVEVCPTQARIFGETEKKASPLRRFMRMNKIGVLKPSLNTEPKVYYANLDMEVR